MTTTRRHPFVCVFLAAVDTTHCFRLCQKCGRDLLINPISQSRIIKVVYLFIWLYGYIASSKPTFWGNISNTWRLLTLIWTSVYWDLIDEVHHSIICLHLGEASIQVVCTIQKGWWVLDMYLDKANIACRLF